MGYKVPFFTTLESENDTFLRNLPAMIDETTISGALNRLLKEIRGCTNTGLLKSIALANK